MYHVAMPVLLDKTKRGAVVPIKPPTSSTQLSQTVVIKPFSATRWPTVHHQAKISWFDMGPHAVPAIQVLLLGHEAMIDYARIVLANVALPMYGILKDHSQELTPLQVLDTCEWKTVTPTLPRGLLCCSYLPAVTYYNDKGIWTMNVHNRLLSNAASTCTVPIGVTSSGNFWWTDAYEKDKSGVLHIFTNWHVERRRGSEPDLLEWAPPTRRHWLVQTWTGDCKDAIPATTSAITSEGKEDNEFGGGNNAAGDEVATGGAISDVLCELGGTTPLANCVPARIVRSPYGPYNAVLFRSSDPASTKGKTNDCHKIAMIEAKELNGVTANRIVQMLDGKDICFLPHTTSDAVPHALILGTGVVTLHARKPNDNRIWQPSTSYRPILGVDANDDYVECRRLVVCPYQEKVALLAVGTKVKDNKSCIVLGKLEEYTGADGEAVWSNMLVNIEEHPNFWLEEGEEVTQIVSLPWEQVIKGGIAVATDKRVMILSPELRLLSELKITVPPNSLAPVGAFTVAFCSHDYKIRYLTGLQVPQFGNGLIATLPMPQFAYNPHLLIAVRPDRLLHCHWNCGTRLVEKGQSSSTFLLPTATTRPALLLEPMIANAISTGGRDIANMPLLRTIIEKFGRKVATMTHGDDEGIGNFGAGMTARVFELLQHYNLKHAASWLLTGTVHFDRAANSRLLPIWMPVAAKVKGALDADTHLHVIAHGDQYFSEYLKSPDNNMSSTLPRPSDPSSYLCNDFAREALTKGELLDAFKMLDIVGTESTDAMLLHLSLALQVESFNDVTKILQSLCQSDSQIGKAGGSNAASCLAALALEYKTRKVAPGQPTSEDFTKKWMKHLSPSLQRGRRAGRIRQRIIGESAFAKLLGKPTKLSRDRLFSTEMSEAKHVWYVEHQMHRFAITTKDRGSQTN